MKRLFTADIHFSAYSQDQMDNETGLPERLSSIKNTLYYMADYCVENNIPEFVMGGDLMHNKSVIYSIAQKILKDFMFYYRGKLTFHILTGNHDLSGKGKEAISSLEFLDFVDDADWISTNACYNKIVLGNASLIPYSYDMVDEIKKNESKSEILISHFGLSEGILNSGISIISKISTQDLINAGYKLVLLGHYHKPQELIVKDQILIYYVGSPIQLDWGEKGDEKRFLIYDDETLQVESVPLEGYKKYIEMVITGENKDQIIQDARIARKAGHYVKILKNEDVNTQDIEDEFAVVDKTEKDITNRGIGLGMTEEERFKRYLEIQGIPEEEHDEYMEEAKTIVGESHEIS